MKQILSAAAILTALTLGACDDVKPRVETSAAPSASSSSMPGMTQPAAASSMPQGDSSALPTTVPAQTAGLNPAHGMPGHTCAIPVGAPLSSAPAEGAAPSITTTPSATAAPTITTTPANSSGPRITPTNPSAPSSTPPAVTMQPMPGSGAAMGSSRLNPPHGQPGHTCDVPVGQPLP